MFGISNVYPFNPDAIDCSVSSVNPQASLQQIRTPSEAKSTSDDNDSSRSHQEAVTLPNLSPEKLKCYQQRIREGYDIPDEEFMKWLEEFMKWLKENHPKTFEECYGCEIISMSLADAFVDVPVASPVIIAETELAENNGISDELYNRKQRWHYCI